MSLSSQPVVDALHTLHGPFERAGIGQVALDRLDAVQRLQAMDVFTGSHQRPPGRFAALGGARSAANQLSQRPANGSAAWSRRQSNHHAYESEYGSDWHFDVREVLSRARAARRSCSRSRLPRAFGFGKGVFSQTRWRF